MSTRRARRPEPGRESRRSELGQQEHGQAFSWADYLPNFLASTFENWQSEWLQLVFQAIPLLGAKHLLFQADAETEVIVLTGEIGGDDDGQGQGQSP